MKKALLVGTKVFYNGKWEYHMDPDDNYYLDEAEYQRQQLESSVDDPPVYICYDGRYTPSYNYNELFEVCEQNRDLTDYIFENLMGELPEDLLSDYMSEGRIVKCPNCDHYIIREQDGRWDYDC